MLGTSITAFMRNNFSHWSWILHHSISTLDFQSEGFQQSALYSAFSRHRFHQPSDILHTQATPTSAAPKTWHHFWKRNHLIYIKFHPRQEETVFEILSKSACSTSRPPAQEGRGQKVHAQPPRLRGSLIHGGWEVEQGWFLVGNNLLTSRPPIHSIITYQSW